MRLHRLEATAFGPFPGTVTVDFDEICGAGLFLIHGPTGSGKTSLLDAICFALYADLPGARSKRMLASHHAAEGTTPSVVLDFSSSGRRFRVERTPEFERPKKRGTGLLRVNATVALEELVGRDWVPLSTRHDEAAHLLDGVLGMGLAQFAKVVVLPQGDISAFLRSSPEERRNLLERLFDITTFTDVEAWLAHERRQTAGAVADTSARIVHELTRLDDILSPQDAPRWGELPLEQVPEALDEAVRALEGEVIDLLAAADRAESASGRAGAALVDAKSTAQARTRGTAAQEAQDEALTHSAEISSLRDTIHRARGAQAVSGHLAGVDTALEAEQVCGDAVADLLLRLPGLPEGQPGALEELVTRLRASDSLVSDLSHALREQTRATDDLAAARDAAQAAQARSSDAAELAGQAAKLRAGIDETVARLTEQVIGYDGAARRLTEAQHVLDLATQVMALRTARDELTPTLVASRRDLIAAQETLVALRQAQLDGMAAALAAGLSSDRECPVCGSTDHPAPALQSDPVTPEQVERAEQLVLDRQTATDALLREDTALESRIDTLRGQLAASGAGQGAEGGAEQIGELTRVRDAAAEHLATLDATRARLAEVEGTQAAARAAAESAEQDQAVATTEVAVAMTTLQAARTRRAEVQRRVGELRARHDEDCGCDEAEGPDIVAIHTTLTTTAGRALDAQHRLAEASGRRAEVEQAALGAAADHGFADLDAARAALLPPATVEAHLRVISDHEQTLAVASATLAEEPVQAALAGPEPDLEAAQAADTAARRAVREAQAAHTSAESRLAVLQSIRGPVTALIDGLAGQRARAAATKELADAVNGTGGGNELRMRLSAFVLAARLEKVVALANERLQSMDAGRYLLEHSDARVAGNVRSGLDLRVLDQWTGRARETSSLSGGESFMVSLALALGLADAVREESGGFDLGTLFIDEGFGSLDEESLEHVMGVLDGLREGGRAVGVVSHVQDLRTRISHQVVVEKQTSGSTLSVRADASPAA